MKKVAMLLRGSVEGMGAWYPKMRCGMSEGAGEIKGIREPATEGNVYKASRQSSLGP